MNERAVAAEQHYAQLRQQVLRALYLCNKLEDAARAQRAELARLLDSARPLLVQDEAAARRLVVRRRTLLDKASENERDLQRARMHSDALIADLQRCGHEAARERTLMVEAELEVERDIRL